MNLCTTWKGHKLFGILELENLEKKIDNSIVRLHINCDCTMQIRGNSNLQPV